MLKGLWVLINVSTFIAFYLRASYHDLIRFFHFSAWMNMNKVLGTSRKKRMPYKNWIIFLLWLVCNKEPGLGWAIKERDEDMFPCRLPFEGGNRTVHGNISEHETLTGLFHDPNAFWTPASRLLLPVLVEVKRDPVFESQNSLGSSLTLLQSKYFPYATGVIKSCSILISLICFHRKVNVCCPQLFMVLIHSTEVRTLSPIRQRYRGKNLTIQRSNPGCLRNKPQMCLLSPYAVSPDRTGFPQDSF